MRHTSGLLALIVLLSPVYSQTALHSEQAAKISVNVDLVVLQPTVRDRKGHTVSNLSKRDFEVYEDGIQQIVRVFQHEDTPVTVGLVIDYSGSMRQKLAHVLAAARTFVQSGNPDDEMFVVNFNEHVTLGLPGRGKNSLR